MKHRRRSAITVHLPAPSAMTETKHRPSAPRVRLYVLQRRARRWFRQTAAVLRARQLFVHVHRQRRMTKDMAAAANGAMRPARRSATIVLLQAPSAMTETKRRPSAPRVRLYVPARRWSHQTAAALRVVLPFMRKSENAVDDAAMKRVRPAVMLINNDLQYAYAQG